MRDAGRNRVFLLGLDGVPARYFRRFVAEGRLPRFARLLARAEAVDLIPTLPALTCPGWLTIASGAHPGSLGVTNILLPLPGMAPDVIANGFDRERAGGELLWETMDRCGLPAIVLKYPGSWPPQPGRFVQVDGAGGYADITCRFEASPSQAYVAGVAGEAGEEGGDTLFPTGYREHWRTHTGAAGGVSELTLRPPRGWRNLPRGSEPAFELVVPIGEHGRRGRRIVHGLACSGAGGEHLLISSEKDAAGAVRLSAAQPWSGWWHTGPRERRHAVRFKLIGLRIDERRLWLYRSAGHLLDGFTRPAAVAEGLLAAAGPPSEWAGAYDSLNGLLDLATQLDVYRQHTDWLAASIRHLATAHPWRGFFTQWHAIEYAHHLVGASLDAEHPLHRAAHAARDVEWLGEVYALADRLLAAVEEVIDDDTLLVVASDHGHDLVHTVFYVNHFLRRHGWLATVERDGRQVVDWSRSAAYALFPGLVLFNRVERWPGGTVTADQAARLEREVTAALRDLVDPRTHRRPVKMVLDRDDLAAFGQWGPHAPDLFFCMDRGYEPATRIEAPPRGDLELEVTTPYREVTSGHGSFFPASASARTFALFSGPGFAPGCLERRSLPLVDLAPTMAAHLGIPPPRGCDGRAVTPGAAAGAILEEAVR